VAEEYCQAIAPEQGQSSCGRSDSSVTDFGFHLVSLVQTYIVDHVYNQFRLAPELSESNCAFTQPVLNIVVDDTSCFGFRWFLIRRSPMRPAILQSFTVFSLKITKKKTYHSHFQH
jgi:hypothetical protein